MAITKETVTRSLPYEKAREAVLEALRADAKWLTDYEKAIAQDPKLAAVHLRSLARDLIEIADWLAENLPNFKG